VVINSSVIFYSFLNGLNYGSKNEDAKNDAYIDYQNLNIVSGTGSFPMLPAVVFFHLYKFL
jgi:hypothetical protein